MFDLNNWNLKLNDLNLINDLHLFDDFLSGKKFLLDINKEKFDFIEKIVYEIALFHINNLNLNSNVFIEFYLNNKNNNNLITENYENIKPVIKTITNLQETNGPNLITNINNETYKFKKFNYTNFICFSNKKCLKHISFDGGNYFHSESISLNNITDYENCDLIVNLWNEKINNSLQTYNNCKDSVIFYGKNEKLINKFFINEDNVKIVTLKKNNFENILDNIFYKKEYSDYNNLYNEISIYFNDYDIFFFDLSEITINNNYCKKTIVDINCKKDINILLPKFQQRFCYKNFYNNFSCNFIVNEINNYIKNNEKDNTDIIDIDKIPNILNIILTSFQDIINYLCLSYCMDPTNKKVEIEHIYILKNDVNNNKTHAYYIQDKTTFSVKILLNNYFKGGNLHFNDDLIMNFEKGELIIHSSISQYYFSEVKQGTQYVINGLVNVYDL
jgi:hypothetical protein